MNATKTQSVSSLGPFHRRDGVWTSNGLSADFLHLYAHPSCDGIHRVRTASGEHYAHESELSWDCSPNAQDTKETAATPSPATSDSAYCAGDKIFIRCYNGPDHELTREDADRLAWGLHACIAARAL